MTHSQRRKRKRRAERVKKALSRPQPAQASNYILHLAEVLKITTNFPLLLCPRVSSQEQYDNGNLERQTSRMRWAARELGAKYIIDTTLPWVGSAVNLKNLNALEFITIAARRYGAIALFESTDRIIRASAFHPYNNPDALPTVVEFERMKEIFEWIPIATILHPNTEWKEIKAYKEKFREGIQEIAMLNREERRDRFLPTVLKLRQQGMSYGEIQKNIPNLSLSLIRFWCQKYANENN